MVKTLSHEEKAVLLRILPDYYNVSTDANKSETNFIENEHESLIEYKDSIF